MIKKDIDLGAIVTVLVATGAIIWQAGEIKADVNSTLAVMSADIRAMNRSLDELREISKEREPRLGSLELRLAMVEEKIRSLEGH